MSRERMCRLTVVTAVLVAPALAAPAFAGMDLPYFEDFEAAVPGGYLAQTDAWGASVFVGPTVTDAMAFSGIHAITDTDDGSVGMQTDFTAGPLTADQAGIRFMFNKADYGDEGEDDRIRIDPYASAGTRAATLVIFDGKVANQQDAEQVIAEGLQLDTWYQAELLFNRKKDDSGYETDATVNIYNADGSLFGTGPLTTGLGSREIPDEIAAFDVRFRGGAGIYVDDIAILSPPCEPGDADKDGDVDDDDLSLMLANWGEETHCGFGEFDGAPPVGDNDLSLLLANWTTPPPVCAPGDANGDGAVDDDDLSLLLANWGSETATCEQGEFTGTLPVDDNDLSLLLANWTGLLAEPAGVPEPMTIMLLFPAAAMIRRRNR